MKMLVSAVGERNMYEIGVMTGVRRRVFTHTFFDSLFNKVENTPSKGSSFSMCCFRISCAACAAYQALLREKRGERRHSREFFCSFARDPCFLPLSRDLLARSSEIEDDLDQVSAGLHLSSHLTANGELLLACNRYCFELEKKTIVCLYCFLEHEIQPS